MAYDAIVLGLGGMGSAAAYQLALRGKNVLGLERYTAPHAHGSSHGHSRIIRQAYIEGPEYVPLLLRAYELWEQIERDTGDDDILTITGGLMMGARDSHTVRGAIRSAEAYGLLHEILDAREIRRRYPPFTPGDDVYALFERKGGFVNPERAISGHLARAAALGAELHFEEPATGWQAFPAGEGVRVSTDKGSYEAAQLIISAGPWAPVVLADLGLPLSIHRQVMYWFDPIGGAAPFLPERFPIYIWEFENVWEPEKGIASFYGFPAQDGPAGPVKIAFHSRFGDPRTTAETIDREVKPHEIARVKEAVAERIPALNSSCVNAVTCMYTVTPDEHFVIARHPEHSQVTVATGFSGHGYKFCSVVGEILADLALDGRTRHDIALFQPERFAQV
jgi:sarcosine oxidase